MLAQPLVYHAIHSDKAAGEYQTLCHKPQYRLADLARGRSEKSHEGKHDGCNDADQRCHLLITDTLHDKNLLLGSAPLASGERGTAVRVSPPVRHHLGYRQCHRRLHRQWRRLLTSYRQRRLNPGSCRSPFQGWARVPPCWPP